MKFYNCLLQARFHILKSLHDVFIINLISYISFNVYRQVIIYPLIFHLIYLFQIYYDLNGFFFLKFKINKYLGLLLLFSQDQIVLLLFFFFFFNNYKGQDIAKRIIFKPISARL